MAKSKKPKKSAPKKSAPAKKSATKKPQPKMKSAKPVAKSAASAKSSAKASPAKNTRASVPAVKFNSKSLTPLDDRLLVTVEAPAETTAGGIIIPGTMSERPSRGTVVASGRGRRGKKGNLRPLDVEVGDTVLFGEYAGMKIEIDGQELLILREEEVLGIVT